MKKRKPVKAKPSFYAYCFELLKRIAESYGYNLVLHGSMDRDLDLIAIPWDIKLGNHEKMIDDFTKCLGGELLPKTEMGVHCHPHGRMGYVIQLCRREGMELTDPEYYIDISVTPTPLTKQ